MKIGGKFSFNKGAEAVKSKYPHLFREVEAVVSAIDSTGHKTKESKEITMPGKILYSPTSLNKAFKREFYHYRWKPYKVNCEYPTKYYTEHHKTSRHKNQGMRPYREMDFVKEKLGIEVQFGKYAFMVYNVCAKMTIFHNRGIIDTGVEIVPVKEFANDMSTGVSYFEQFVWDLEQRGVADIDIPVLILGIEA